MLVGPEVITGSTRMKAGTATKLVLNTITTGAMIRIGKTYGNLMVDLRASNAKLSDRSRRIVMETTGLSREAATDVLRRADGRVKAAIVMARLGADRTQAQALLEAARRQAPPCRRRSAAGGRMSERPVLGIGLMSGTSLDGMDAALVRFHGPTHAELLAFVSRPYDAMERARIVAGLDGAGAADLARLHVTVADWASEAVEQLLATTHVPASEVDFLAMHGQTIWHEPPFVSWQLGEPAVLAERFGRPIVSNFRARDVAAGGQGAPLVPAADVLLFGAAGGPRVLLNVGGMANLTFVVRRAQDEGAFAFDTGPGMVLVEPLRASSIHPSRSMSTDDSPAVARCARRKSRDCWAIPSSPRHRPAAPGASISARPGARHSFSRPWPRRRGHGGRADRSLHRGCVGPLGAAGSRCGRLGRRGPPSGALSLARPGTRGQGRQLVRFDELFFNGDAKEAVAFALLGYLTLHGQPANLPSCTGARGARVLGSITPG